ncbi:MAG: hypothetical protein NVS1B13_19780 [Flavisolibacter sp.]
MKRKEFTTHRRGFLGSLATGAVAAGLATIATPLQAMAHQPNNSDPDDPDAWFNKVKGKHKIVFDATGPHEVFPFAWPLVFMMTNEKPGETERNATAVVVLRHDAIPYALDTPLWEKYHLGEVFKISDPHTKASSLRNAFWKPSPGDYKIPGIGNVNIGINELQEKGVMFCVCNVALTVYSAAIAEKMGVESSKVFKDFTTGVLPGIQIVPSGVWAVGRAQEHGCAYCFVG